MTKVMLMKMTTKPLTDWRDRSPGVLRCWRSSWSGSMSSASQMPVMNSENSARPSSRGFRFVTCCFVCSCFLQPILSGNPRDSRRWLIDTESVVLEMFFPAKISWWVLSNHCLWNRAVQIGYGLSLICSCIMIRDSVFTLTDFYTVADIQCIILYICSLD